LQIYAMKSASLSNEKMEIVCVVLFVFSWFNCTENGGGVVWLVNSGRKCSSA